MRGTFENCEDLAICFMCMIHFYLAADDHHFVGNGTCMDDTRPGVASLLSQEWTAVTVHAPRLLV